jgi:hypothetical protein
MPVQGNLTLNTKVYNPRGKSGDVASWVLAGDATFGGATSTVTESVRGPSKDGFTRSRFKLDIPKNADEASACACPGGVLGQGGVEIIVITHSSMTAAERTDLTLRAQGLVANAIFTAAAANNEGSW